MSIENNPNYVELEEYKNMLNKLPIPCIDIVILNEKNEILLLKRDNEPALNEWWVPGGRIHKNESFKCAALRKAKEELGLDAEFVQMLGFGETIFDIGPFEDITTHTVNAYALLKADITKITIDSLHSDYKFSSNENDVINPYLKKLFKDTYGVLK